MMRLPSQQVSILVSSGCRPDRCICLCFGSVGSSTLFWGGWHLRGFCMIVLHTWQIHASHLLAADLADGTVLPCAAALFMIRLQARQVGACTSPGCKQKRVL